jgi:hypothetical protein
MTNQSHTHRCRRCGTTYDCDGEWVPAEQADGYLKAACYFYDLHQINLCETCAKPVLPDADDLARMLAHPQFGALRRFKDDDWLVVFDEATHGRSWRGNSLAEVVEKWREQYSRREVA